MTLRESLDEPLLAELYSYWQDRCHGRRAPSRADIDPIDIPNLLPHLALVELVEAGREDPFRIRIRLAGTKIEESFGCPLTNRYFDELVEGPFADYITGLYQRVGAEMAPLYTQSSFGPDAALHAKRLMLPLSEDGKTANMVLTGVLFSDGNPPERKTVLHSHDQFSSAGPESL